MIDPSGTGYLWGSVVTPSTGLRLWTAYILHSSIDSIFHWKVCEQAEESSRGSGKSSGEYWVRIPWNSCLKVISGMFILQFQQISIPFPQNLWYNIVKNVIFAYYNWYNLQNESELITNPPIKQSASM